MSKTNKQWKKQIRQEFGIHFKDSPDEFHFLIAAIEDLLSKQKKTLIEKIWHNKIEVKKLIEKSDEYYESDKLTEEFIKFIKKL